MIQIMINMMNNHELRYKTGNSILKSELSDYSIEEITKHFIENPEIFNQITYKIRKNKLN